MGEYRYLLSKLEFAHTKPSASLADAANSDVLIRLPAQSDVFFGAWLDVCAKVGNGVATVLVSEAPTNSATGSAGTPVNRSRLDTPPASVVSVFDGSTITGTGTKLHEGIATPSVKYKSGCWLLKPGTDYLVRLTNVTGGATAIRALISLGLKRVQTKDYLYHPTL